MKTHITYIAIILTLALLGGLGFWNMEEKQTKLELQLKEQQTIIDNIEQLEHENDTIDYTSNTDSIRRILTKKYRDRQYNN